MSDLWIQALSVALIDPSDPVVTDVKGRLASDGSHAGAEALTFMAQDSGSGMYRAFIDTRTAGSEFVNRKTVTVDDNGGRCAELAFYTNTPYEFGYRVPCKLSVSEELEFDTTTISDGSHEIRVRVEDASGNSATVLGPKPFVVDNQPGVGVPAATATPTGGSGSTAGGGSSVGTPGARVSLSGARRRFLSFGKRTVVAATLRDANGRAIAGAMVGVLQRMRVPGAGWVLARAPLRTGTDGRVRWVVPPGPSREIRLAYGKATARVVLNVRSKTTLKGSRSYLRNGGTLRFRGRLLSRPVPRSGVVVELQAQVGSRWVTFNTQRTKKGGRWRARYTFRSTSGLQRYRFRARVRRDTGYPYAPSLSRAISVRVRG